MFKMLEIVTHMTLIIGVREMLREMKGKEILRRSRGKQTKKTKKIKQKYQVLVIVVRLL